MKNILCRKIFLIVVVIFSIIVIPLIFLHTYSLVDISGYCTFVGGEWILNVQVCKSVPEFMCMVADGEYFSCGRPCPEGSTCTRECAAECVFG